VSIEPSMNRALARNQVMMSNDCNFGTPSKILRVQSRRSARFSFVRVRTVSLGSLSPVADLLAR
jgi:hypothetical protein